MRPASLVHVGVIECVGLLLSEEHLGSERTRSFVLANLRGLRSVSQTPRGLLVRLLEPRALRCDRTIGLPLTTASHAGRPLLLALPLDEHALEQLAPPPGAIVHAWHGAIEVLAPPFRDVDPALWIDLDDLPIISSAPLGEPPKPPKRTLPVARPLHAILDADLPEHPSAAAREVMETIKRMTAERDAEPRATARISPASRARAVLATAFARTLAATIALLRSLWGGKATEANGAATEPPSTESALAAPAAPSLLRRVLRGLDRWVRRQIAFSKLSSWLFRKQAAYVARLLEAFDEGDLDEALRRAIPLAKEGGQSEGSIALGLPPPRADLAISPGGLTPGGASLSFGPSLYAELKRRYKLAFERLEREGRIAEAAFVLAELLQDAEAAVALLERHGLLRQAAELAESRSLSPGLVVRQWFRAGDHARALRVARRRGGMLDAITRLERSGHREQANALRVYFAEHLASTGDFAGAVDLAWKVKEARALVAVWAESGLAQGGIGGARMLARQLLDELAPLDLIAKEVRELAYEAGADGRGRRLAFASTLTDRSGSLSDGGAALATSMVRALYADAPASFDKRIESVTTALVELSRDPGLRADRPRWPGLAFARHYRHVIRADDRGRSRLFDAIPLDRGRTVIALGEGGVALVDVRGKTLAHFDQPAEALVVSDRMDRLLTVAPRGGVSKIGRIDLVSRRSEPFCELELESFARTFDGATWLATVSTHADPQSDLVVIDVCDTELSLMGGITGLGLLSVDIVRTSDHVDVVSVVGPGSYYAYTYELPGLTLRRRWDLSLDDTLHQRWLTAPDSVYIGLIEREGDLRLHVATRGNKELWRQSAIDVSGARLDARGHALGERFLALGVGTPSAGVFTVKVLRRKDLTSVGELVFEETEDARLRLVGDSLVVTDARGRVVALDLESGEITRNVRI